MDLYIEGVHVGRKAPGHTPEQYYAEKGRWEYEGVSHILDNIFHGAVWGTPNRPITEKDLKWVYTLATGEKETDSTLETR